MVGLKHLNDSKAFIKYSNDINDGCKSIDNYNPKKKSKVLIMFDGMTSDMVSNKKLHPVVTELYIKFHKLNISLAYVLRFYFPVPKDVRLNTKHFLS